MEDELDPLEGTGVLKASGAAPDELNEKAAATDSVSAARIASTLRAAPGSILKASVQSSVERSIQN